MKTYPTPVERLIPGPMGTEVELGFLESGERVTVNKCGDGLHLTVWWVEDEFGYSSTPVPHVQRLLEEGFKYIDRKFVYVQSPRIEELEMVKAYRLLEKKLGTFPRLCCCGSGKLMVNCFPEDDHLYCG